MGVFSLFSKKPQDNGAGDNPEPPVKPRRSPRTAKPQEGEASDLMLPEKKRARRRLVGAIALVLAAIIGLPMIFDSEPKPLDDDIDIQIPSRDKPEFAAARPAPQPAEPVPADTQPEMKSEAKPETKVETKPAALPERSDAKPSPTAADGMPAAAEKKPVPQQPAAAQVNSGSVARAPASPDKPVEKTLDKPTDKAVDKIAEKIAEKTADKPADKPADKQVADKPAQKVGAGNERYVVQVAAVSSQAKADELQNRLKKAGIQSYSLKVSTRDGDRIRIRIGPMGSRGEADRMRTRLGALGLSGTVQPE